MDSLAGHFLVASPHLPDPNFFRTVVLLLRHDDEGAFGVVLNRPLENSLEDVWNALGNSEVHRQQPLYLGGPVAGPLLAIHCEPDCAEGDVVSNVFYATHKDYLNKIVTESNRPFRVFSGYSGWGEGQLEHEFEEGSWLSTPASIHEIFANVDEFWKAIAARIGLEILLPSINVNHIPLDPEMN